MRLALPLFLVALGLQAQQPCTSSNELSRIHDEDQADRETDAVDWSVVAPRDEARSERVAEILEESKNLCPESLFHAALVFQHGSTPQHQLRAHVLATAAAIAGYKPAIWLSAASLDRYLQGVGQPQIFGANNRKNDHEPWTQEPFDRTLVSAELRAFFRVDSLGVQQRKLDELNASTSR